LRRRLRMIIRQEDSLGLWVLANLDQELYVSKWS